MIRPRRPGMTEVLGLRRLLASTALAGALALGLPLALSPAQAQGLGFSISVDGEHVAGDEPPVNPVDPNRAADVALAETDIQVTFDGLEVQPVLNALPVTLRRGYRAGETVEFFLTANYPAWIERAEIRIYEEGVNRPVAVLPAPVNGTVAWVMPADGEADYFFTARVYDANDRFDETTSLNLFRTEAIADTQADPDLVAAGWGEDRTQSRTIRVFGGAVTVHGDHVPPGGSVVALGETVPVDRDGSFVIQRILPSGDHVVAVAVTEPSGAAMAFNRGINIPSDDWFYVAMADLTVGQRFGNGEIIAANPDEFDGVYMKGHVAFYLRGKIRGEYLLTAAGDTGEGPVDEMFSGILTEDPQAVLRRIDPNEYYPVYGDDSTLVDNAPTSGKLYVRLERGESHVMWGNFRTEVGESTLLRSDRALYGASAVYRSEQTTANGEHRFAASAYAAQPDSLTERDVLRGTGGSAYFLRHTDLVIGSETVTIEIRNAVTGQVVSTRTLTEGADYRINWMQGVVLLTDPLASTASSDGAVQSPDGDIVNLVVQYEYTPTDMPVSDYAVGGDAHVWLNDHVRIGGTASAERDDMTDHRLLGADIRVQSTENTFVEAEIAQSRGTAAPNFLSTDGGLTYVQQAAAGGSGQAYAYRLNAQVDFSDLSAGDVEGTAGVTVEYLESGFSSIQRQVTDDQWNLHAFADVELGERYGLGLVYDFYRDDDGRETHEATAEVEYELNAFWEIAVAAGYFDRASPGGGASENGNRTDLGLRVTYTPHDDLSLYAFGQATVARTDGFARNDRVGVGADWTINERWALGAEIFYATAGIGGEALLTYQPSADVRNYVGLQWDADHAPGEGGSYGDPVTGIIFGTERRYSDTMSIFTENNYGLRSDNHTLTSTYGVNYTPDTRWTITGAAELGMIRDPDLSDFDRQAFSLGATFKDDGFDAWARGEVRLEDSDDGTRDRQTYLIQAGYNRQTNPEWRLLTNIDAVISSSDQDDILDGDYVEANLGYAYRPIDNERLNALFRYTFLFDLPGPDQVDNDGDDLGPSQRSHIFSVDGNYDLSERLTVGAKYGFRIGETESVRGANDFSLSSAHLGIIRADWEFHSDWDILLEGRVLFMPEIDTTDLGLLGAIYRGVGEHLKLGVGYNFGEFSDDLSDLVFDDQGWFFNLIAKY